MFKLSLGDLWRGIIMAITAPLATAILGVLGAIILASNFDVFAVDWGTVGKNLINVSIVSSYSGFAGYILKNLLTDNNQNFLGIPTKS